MNPTNLASLVSQVDINMVFRGVIVYLFLLWFCMVVWVVKDITNRSRSVVFQVFCVLLVLVLTPLGIGIYLLIRPQKTIFERIFEAEFLELENEYKKQTSSPTTPKNTKKAPPSGLDIQKKTPESSSPE